jgi:ribonuclease HI
MSRSTNIPNGIKRHTR